MSSLSLKNVYKYYYSEKKLTAAVKDLSFDLEDGHILSILGPSGCGKSSTMRMIAGLEQVNRGEILIDEKKANGLDPTERNIALAFESYALYQHLSVGENISFCLKQKRIDKEKIEKKVRDIVLYLGIEKLLKKRPSELSGGQQQLVSLGRALVRDPSITLLDEPLSHLDTNTRLAVSQLIKGLHSKLGLTIVYVTHNQEEALAIADNVLIMNMSEQQQYGKVKDIINFPINTFVAGFIGQPSMNFITCNIEKTGDMMKARSGKLSFEIAKRFKKDIAKRNIEKLVVGIRPVDLFLQKRLSSYSVFNGEIESYEFLGENANIKIRAESNNLIAVVRPDDHIKKGDPANLFYDVEKLHLFEQSSGNRIIDN